MQLEIKKVSNNVTNNSGVGMATNLNLFSLRATAWLVKYENS